MGTTREATLQPLHTQACPLDRNKVRDQVIKALRAEAEDEVEEGNGTSHLLKARTIASHSGTWLQFPAPSSLPLAMVQTYS